MAKRIASKIAKEAAARAAAKKGRNAPQSRAISGAPEKGTVGAQKASKAKATPARRGRPKGSTNKATGVTTQRKSARATKAKGTAPAPAKGKTSGLNKREKAGLALAGATAAGFVGTGLSKRKKPAAKVTFGEAFKEARKKGEGTKFTWEGKQYTAVTKDDLKKKGYDANELRQYANRKGKARGPLNRLGQKAKKVLLGKDKKFGGDKGAIDFIRRPKKKAAGGMANSKPKKFKAGGMATKGLGKAYMNSKR